MLSGKMSNEDEDEVEDELKALEREAGLVENLPNAPNLAPLPDAPNGVLQETAREETAKERMIRRRRERAEREQSEAIAA